MSLFEYFDVSVMTIIWLVFISWLPWQLQDIVMGLHILLSIFVSSREDSQMFASSSVFPRVKLCCIIKLCRRQFRSFQALIYQITRMSGDRSCCLSMITLEISNLMK